MATTEAARTEQDETRLDKLGIPHVLRWGFLGVLVFMTGHGVESNIVSPHIGEALGDQAIVPTIVAMYGVAVIVASYLSGALSDLFGPRKVMLLGFAIWVVFQACFLLSLAIGSTPLVFVSYFLRGFGYPLFAFAFLVWVNAVVPRKRNGAAVGWFYVMFTGGLPTFGSLYAVITIPLFGGGYGGETWAMVSSSVLVAAGFLIVWLGVKEPRGRSRLAPPDETRGAVLLSGLRLTVRQPKILMGFLVRLINTSPEYGMFIILPAVITTQLGFGQSRWLLMTVAVYAGNILFNALFGTIGDRWGWQRTVKWFGIVGSAVGLLAWWYVPRWVPADTTWGYVVAVAAGVAFGIMLAGFVPMGAIMPALAPDHKGAAMAMYTTAAGGAAFSGAAVVAVVKPWGGNVGVVWAFVALYAVAFVLVSFLTVPEDS
jgi:MFS family permease